MFWVAIMRKSLHIGWLVVPDYADLHVSPTEDVKEQRDQSKDHKINGQHASAGRLNPKHSANHTESYEI